MKKSEEPHWL